MKNKKLIKTIITIIVLIVLALMFLYANPEEMLQSISSVNFSTLLIVLGLQVLTQLLLNLQWMGIVHSMKLNNSFWKLLCINSQGSVMESITPGVKVGGEVVRVIMMKESLGHTTAQATSVVALQKIISLSSLITLNLMAFVFLPNDIPVISSNSLKLTLLVIMVFFLLLFYYLLFHTPSLAALLRKSKYQGKWYLGLCDWVDEFCTHTAAIKGKKGFLYLQFLLGLVIWALFPFKLVILVRDYSVDANMLGLLIATLTAYIVAMLPLTPGGIGSFEVSMVSILKNIGYTAEQGLIISVVFRFITFWFVIIMSLVVLGINRIVFGTKFFDKTPKK